MSTPRRIPIEDFFRKPERVSVQISPDGAFLAWMAPHERRLNVHVRDLATGEERRVTSSTERDIGGYSWVSDRRIVFVQDTGGDENFRLHAVDADGANPLDLTPFDDVQCDIVDDLEDVPGEILFSMNKRDPHCFDVYRLHLDTGEMECVAENPGSIRAWVTDHAGRLRVAVATDGVNGSLLYRATEDAEWSVVAEHDFKESLTPLFFTFDDERLYVASNLGRDKTAIYEYDPETRELGELIFEHADVDVDGLFGSKKRKAITGVSYETDKRAYHFFDDERRRIQEFVDGQLPGCRNALVSQTRDETRFIVYSGGDRTYGRYSQLDWGEAPKLTPLFDVAPWLKEDELAEVRPVSYTTRDGLTIHGYLTLPVGVEPKSLPLLVNPHGGPWVRDSWGFNPEVQLLANRGIAVLQPNYRGSTGYGRAFWEASFKQWGLAMQDDVTDGVRWAIDEGIADPERVAIYGASYGGYATLAGITKEPDLFACAISYVGVSNLFTWIEAFPPYWQPMLDMVHEMVGHPERDADQWRATSPFFHADKIRCPLFVAQGANDPRVKQEESDQIVAALRERGIDVDYMVKDNEGHGFHNEENTFEFYGELERFLTKHLGL